MAQFINMYKVELNDGAAPVVPLKQMHYADIKANRIGAIVTLNKEPFPLTGTCTGTAILADGSTVPMTGTVSGNTAYIELASSCYSVEGQIQVFVKLTTGGVTTTLVAGVGAVRLTETDAVIDPGTIIPSVSALINAIEDAVESIPADYSGLLATIAPTFSADKIGGYAVGDYVWYSGNLYRFTAAHTGSWTGTDAVRTTVSEGLNSGAVRYDTDMNITAAQKATARHNILAAGQNDLAPLFSASGSYTAGQYVYYNDVLYRFTADHPAGAWTGTDAAVAVLGGDVTVLKSALNNDTFYTWRAKAFINLSGNVENYNGEYSAQENYIPVEGGSTIVASCPTNHTGFLGIAFYNNTKRFISGIKSSGTDNTETEITVPATACYCRMSAITGQESKTYIKNVTRTAVEAVTNNNNNNNTRYVLPALGYAWEPGYIDAKGTLNPHATYSSSGYLMCKPGINIIVSGTSNHTGVVAVAFYNIKQQFLSCIINNGIPDYTEFNATVPNNAYFFRLCSYANRTEEAYAKITDSVIADVANAVRTTTTTTADIALGYDFNIQGFITLTGGHSSSDTSRHHTDYILCEPGQVIKYYGETNHNNVAGIAFYDSKKTYITGSAQVNVGPMDVEYTATAPANARYFRCSGTNGHKAQIIITDAVVQHRIDEIASAFGDSEFDFAVKSRKLNPNNLLDESVYNNKSNASFDGATLTVQYGGWWFYNIDVSQLIGDEECIWFMADVVSGVNAVNTNYEISSSYGTGTGTPTPLTVKDGVIYAKVPLTDFDATNKYFQIRFDGRVSEADTALVLKNLICFTGYYYSGVAGSGSGGSAFVATNGSDSGDGSLTAPFATVNAALRKGARDIFLIGGTYEQSINLQGITGCVRLSSYTANEKVIFKDPERIKIIESTVVSGKQYVREVPLAANPGLANNWFYQEGVPDIDTLILDEERHPLQRGYEYRLEDTRIYNLTRLSFSTTSNYNAGSLVVNQNKLYRAKETVYAGEWDTSKWDLVDPIELIENDYGTKYRWFYDADAQKLYFTSPVAPSASNPLCASMAQGLFRNATRAVTLICNGIETKYFQFNINRTTGTVCTDCRASNVWGGGGFIYDQNLGGQFIRCEAAAVQQGSNGDGFNGHAQNTGDIHAKQITVSLIDCWSHDNQDDGYSDHERSEITIIGGLYEYNGKGGITPSYGSHCTCYGVISRNNYNGFYYTGGADSAEGGKYGQMLCIECIAEGNYAEAGFRVDGAGNRMDLYDCHSRGNSVGFTCATASFAKLVNCYAKGNTRMFNDQANHITIDNDELVTAN